MLLVVVAQALGIKQLEIGKVLFATSVLRASHLQQTQVPAPSCTVCMLSCRPDFHVTFNITLHNGKDTDVTAELLLDIFTV